MKHLLRVLHLMKSQMDIYNIYDRSKSDDDSNSAVMIMQKITRHYFLNVLLLFNEENAGSPKQKTKIAIASHHIQQ